MTPMKKLLHDDELRRTRVFLQQLVQSDLTVVLKATKQTGSKGSWAFSLSAASCSMSSSFSRYGSMSSLKLSLLQEHRASRYHRHLPTALNAAHQTADEAHARRSWSMRLIFPPMKTRILQSFHLLLLVSRKGISSVRPADTVI
ncbi:hypothetical protein EYF80_061522 [Liparis tanakae]|uniref:Uncharacterized protein n=1 Tax=Liparis tanakae TaxID=230148 RepID=A0A4Z2EJ15_9TELE|nr:hypothetical protein EYF80_061522 [Liparis tanakae]